MSVVVVVDATRHHPPSFVLTRWLMQGKGASKADMEAAKKAELAAKKAERDRLLAEEEASAPVKKKAPSAKDKKAAAEAKLKAQNASIAAVFRTDDPMGVRRDEDRKVDELSAVGIEGMLEALEVVNAKTSDEAMGSKVSGPAEERTDPRPGRSSGTPRSGTRRRLRRTSSARCPSSRRTTPGCARTRCARSSTSSSRRRPRTRSTRSASRTMPTRRSGWTRSRRR